MKIFVPDDGFYGAVAGIGGAFGVGQHVGRIEDVQAFVFHGPHIEVARGHDHEPVQVELQAEALFVPFDGARPAVKWDERSEEHTSELQSLMRNSYAVFFLTKKKQIQSI